MLSGSSSFYLPIVHYSLLVYSKLVSSFLEKNNHILFAKSDFQFMEEVFAIMEKHAGYKAPLNVNQFFMAGSYIQERLQISIEVAAFARSKHTMLGKRSSSVKENIG